MSKPGEGFLSEGTLVLSSFSTPYVSSSPLHLRFSPASIALISHPNLAIEFFSLKERRRGSSLPPRLESTNFTTEEGVDKVVSKDFGPRKMGVLLG